MSDETTAENTTTVPENSPQKYGKVLNFPPSGEPFTAKEIAAANNVSPSFVHVYLKHRLAGKYHEVKKIKSGRGKPASVFTLN